MVVTVNSYFNPFRMKLSSREPVQLSIELKNDGNEDKIVSMQVLLSKQLSFGKGGYQTEEMVRLPKLAPGERKQYYYEVWPKTGTRTEDQPVKIKIAEHYKNFNYVMKEYAYNLSLRVDE